MKKILFLSLLVLVGCNDSDNDQRSKKNIVSVPALPIIQQSLISHAPLFGGMRDDGHINALCALVRGDITDQEMADYLKENEIDAKTDQDFALFIGPKRPEQMAACAAYIATSVLIPPSLEEFMEPVEELEKEKPNTTVRPDEEGEKATDQPAKVKESAEQHAQELKLPQETDSHSSSSVKLPAKDKGKLAGKEKKGRKELQELPELQLNQEKLAHTLASKLAIAQANTDIFVLIAKQLPAGLTLEEYYKESYRVFSHLAPLYLDRIQNYYQPEVHYNLLQMREEHFAFNSSSGYLFDFDMQGLNLQLDGINWYGQGQLMGRDWYLSVDYFQPEVIELLNQLSR